ncbi:MAG: M15 family metallopeptidase [Melioribacteraceae bacterium]|nr:M15 family metallopeptidase [Melioribacteraceae bacterium]
MRTLSAFILVLFFCLNHITGAQTSYDEFVRIKDIIPDIAVDLKYATTDNVFDQQKLYTANECYMLKELAYRLKLVQDSLRNVRSFNGSDYPEGLGLKIWDGYRPRSVQYVMFDIFPDPTFVANPDNGSGHNRGGAVDVTLIDISTGQELFMPTGFDDFSDAAGHDYPKHLLHPIVYNNREYLKSIMLNVGGLSYYIAEWWHYQLSDNNKYPLMDFQMK